MEIVARIRDTVGSISGELWSDGRGWILIAVSAGWFLSFGVRISYSALVPFFREAFQIDLATAGLLLTFLWGAYALGQLPGGILGDRIGEGNILVLSTLISGIGVMIVGFSVGIWMVFAATVLFGLGTAMYGPTRFTVFTDIYDTRAGSAIGLTMAAGSAGNAIIPVTAVFIAGALSWRYSFAVAVPFFALVTLFLWIAVPSYTASSRSAIDELSMRTLRRIAEGLRDRPIPTITAIQILLSFVFQGFVGFYPTYLVDVKGLDPSTGALLFGLFFAIAIVVQPLAGSGLDRFGPRHSLMGVLVLTAGSLWILPLTTGVLPLIGLTVVLSTITGYGVITQTTMASALPDDMKGTGLGILRTMFVLFGATSPAIVGFLGDAGLFNEAFMLLAFFATVALTLVILRLR